MNYAGVGLIALLVHIIINFDVMLKNRGKIESKSHHIYKTFLWCVFVYYIFDILWGFIYDIKIPLLSFIWTELYFISVAAAVFFWTRFVIIYINRESIFTNIIKFAGVIFLIGESAILIMNIFKPVMFRFTEDGTYITGKARTITMYAQILLFLSTSVYMPIVAAKARGKIKRRYVTIACFGIAMTVFVIHATAFPILPFYSLGYLFGTCLIHTFVVEDEKEARREELEQLLKVEEIQAQELGSARLMAYTDPLTGVKSKNAYHEDILGIDRRIEDGILKHFGIVVCDVNGLKLTNDTLGHEEGDRLIKSAGKLICHTFVHSPVYRIGGDEFVVFLHGEDYANRKKLMKDFNRQVETNAGDGKVVVAAGMSEYLPGADENYGSLFSRADRKMYERKKQLKAMK